MNTLTIPDTTTAPEITLKEAHQRPQGFHVPARVVADKIAHYPAEAQRAIMLYAGVLRQNGWTLAEAAQMLSHRGYRAKHAGEGGSIDRSTLSLILSGKYPSSPLKVARTLGEFAEAWHRTQLTQGRRLVETRIVCAVGEICRAAADWKKPAFIWGRTQEGKTTGLQAFAAGRPNAIYFRTPAAVGFHSGLRELVRVAGGTPGKTIERTRSELFSSVTSDHVVIVDEMHQAFTTWPKTAALRFWEVLRDLWDAKKCALIICGTAEISKQMRKGAFRELLKQLAERTQLHLDTDAAERLAVGSNAGTVRDINAVLASYGAPMLQVTGGGKGGPEADRRRFAYFRDRILSHSMCDMFSTLERAAKLAAGSPDFGHIDRAIAELAELGVEW